MLDVNAWIYKSLIEDFDLIQLLGDETHIFFGYPRSFTTLPIVTFQELNQAHELYDDDAPLSVTSYVQIDIWTDDNGPTEIMIKVDKVMQSLLFNCEYSADTPEPDTLFRHRAMRYRRQLIAEDLT